MVGVRAKIVVDDMAILLGLTDMVYDPLIIWEPIAAADALFCVGYAVLCLMPLALELWTDYRYISSLQTLPGS